MRARSSDDQRSLTSGPAVLPAPGILSPRKDHQQGRYGLRPPRRLLRKRRPLPDDLARQENRHLSGGRGENRGSRNQPGRPGVQAHMRRVCCVTAAAVASIAILTGCSDQPGPRQTVTGLLIWVGGPATLSHQQNRAPLAGTVVARNATGGQFTTTTGNNGRFQLSLPPGTYRLTGHSPQVIVFSQQELCLAARTVHLTRYRPLHNIWVVCSIP